MRFWTHSLLALASCLALGQLHGTAAWVAAVSVFANALVMLDSA